MKFDLKRACTNCPFMNIPERITFAARERAEEIEETAYRQGFPCHEHAEWIEADDDYLGDGGAGWKRDGSTQHCWGSLAMHLQNGGSIPWERAIEDDEDLEQRWWDRADPKALRLVFKNEDEFLDANTNRRI